MTALRRARSATRTGRSPTASPTCSAGSPLAEKIALLHQYQAAVPRLGVGPFRTGTEALHGLAWLGPATVFPQARRAWPAPGTRTWSSAVGAAVGDEVRGFHHKDPDAGRPQRVGAGGQPAARPALGPQRGGLRRGPVADRRRRAPRTPPACAATTRATCGPRRRSSTSSATTTRPTATPRRATCGPRVLHEYELPAFRAPIAAGAAVAVMASYNLVNGRPAHLSPLINDELRAWTADDLLVVSDAGGAVEHRRVAGATGPTTSAGFARRAAGRRRQLHRGRRRPGAAPSSRLTEALDRGLTHRGRRGHRGAARPRHPVPARRVRPAGAQPVRRDHRRGHQLRRRTRSSPARRPGAVDRAAAQRRPAAARPRPQRASPCSGRSPTRCTTTGTAAPCRTR